MTLFIWSERKKFFKWICSKVHHGILSKIVVAQKFDQPSKFSFIFNSIWLFDNHFFCFRCRNSILRQNSFTLVCKLKFLTQLKHIVSQFNYQMTMQMTLYAILIVIFFGIWWINRRPAVCCWRSKTGSGFQRDSSCEQRLQNNSIVRLQRQILGLVFLSTWFVSIFALSRSLNIPLH